MPVEQSLSSALSEWSQWHINNTPLLAKPELIETYTDGLNHEIALLQIGDQQHVIKVFNSLHPGAIKAQQWASKLGISPTVNYYKGDFSYCLMDKVTGKSIMPETVNDHTLRALATSLKTAHTAGIPDFIQYLTQHLSPDLSKTSNPFNLLSFCEQSLQSAGRRANELHKSISPFLTGFINDKTPYTFCHNDLVVANCFISDQSAILIDWEYAQMNNPWFDLAAIIYYCQLNQKQASYFLDQYQMGWSNKVGSAIYYNAQLALLWSDMLWHLAKFGEEYWQNLEQKLSDLEQLCSLQSSLS